MKYMIPTPMDITISKKLILFIAAQFMGLVAIAVLVGASIMAAAYTPEEVMQDTVIATMALLVNIAAIVAIPTIYEIFRRGGSNLSLASPKRVIAMVLSGGATSAVLGVIYTIVLGLISIAFALRIPQLFVPLLDNIVALLGLVVVLFIALVVLIIYSAYLQFWLYEKWRNRV